jgi:3-hydroxyisobutyrate dehydrogenase-like beta-hydroxyacid dehydrogenase
MKIGFIGFGKVGSTLASGLIKKRIEIGTCSEGRSSKTQKIAKEMGVNIFGSNRELAQKSDILISAVTPGTAVEVAQDVGEYVRGIYVDINNISPKNKKKALSFIENGRVVDASIIGSVKKGLSVLIIASGKYAQEFAKLNKYGMNINIVGDELGEASAVKIFRSSFTKGLSALLFETLYSAYQMGIDEEVLNYISETECEGFKNSAISRIISSAYHAKRRYEEMDEVIELLKEAGDPKMSEATKNFYKMLFEKLDKLDHEPEDYDEIFENL